MGNKKARALLKSSTHVCRSPNSEASSAAFLGQSAERWLKNRTARTETGALIRDAGFEASDLS